MGAVCTCGPEKGDISTFWKGMELRKITFENYCKIYEKNQINWLSSVDENNCIDLRKCLELNKLLYNSDFTEAENNLFLEKLNEFANNQTDKLTFFTCLSFFAKLNEEESTKTKKTEKQSYIETLRSNERSKNFDIVFDSLLKMAIKKNDHEDVTKLFIKLVTVFPVPFIYPSAKEQNEYSSIYSNQNRELLFRRIRMYNNQKFYEYMFNKNNVFVIHNDLMKIHLSSQNSAVNENDKVTDIITKKD